MREKDIIYRRLRESIASNRFPGGCLPTERELMTEFFVARGTVRAALAQLEKENRIERIRSRGTFVKMSPDVSPRRLLHVVSRAGDVSNPFLYILPGVESEARLRECEVISMALEQLSGMTQKEFNSAFFRKNIIGLVLSMNANALTPEDPWNNSAFPVVISHVPNASNIPEAVSSVYTDVRAEWQAGIEYLLGIGHRRIAVLVNNSSAPRGMPFEEYFSLLEAHGADTERDLVACSSYDREAIDHAVSGLLGLPRPPTALLCFSDFYAMYACEAIKRRGLRIPDDIALMGSCGYPGAKFFDPSLSTVDYRYFDCGVKAVRMILDGKRNECIRVVGNIIERASTRCVKNEDSGNKGKHSLEAIPNATDGCVPLINGSFCQ